MDEVSVVNSGRTRAGKQACFQCVLEVRACEYETELSEMPFVQARGLHIGQNYKTLD